MKEIVIKLEENIYNEAEKILEEYGLEVKGVIETVLKRVARQGSAEFIFAKGTTTTTAVVEPKSSERVSMSTVVAPTVTKMSKNIAKSMFNKNGHVFSAPVIYSSLNTATGNYWANPEKDVVKGLWYLILNDQYKRVLRLFKMDGNGLFDDEKQADSEFDFQLINDMLSLVPRADKPHLINLQIYGNDTVYFRDKISGVAFKPYLIDEVNY